MGLLAVIHAAQRSTKHAAVPQETNVELSPETQQQIIDKARRLVMSVLLDDPIEDQDQEIKVELSAAKQQQIRDKARRLAFSLLPDDPIEDADEEKNGNE